MQTASRPILYTQQIYQETEQLKRFSGDYLSDDEFNQLQLSSLSPLPKKVYRKVDTPVDEVETVTMQILLHLQQFADRKNHSEIEAAIAPASNPRIKKDFQVHQRTISSHSVRAFRKDTNFYGHEDLEQPIHTAHVAHNIFSTLGNIFLGYEFSNSQQDSRSPEKMMLALDDDRAAWDRFQNYYKLPFRRRMIETFSQARDLLKARQIATKEARYQRLTLYASLIMSFVGKLISQKGVTILGLIASSITLLFMLTQYGATSVKLARLSSLLERSVGQAEGEAGIYRLEKSF